VDSGALRPWRAREAGVLDLHGFPGEVAKVAVRAAVMDALSPCRSTPARLAAGGSASGSRAAGPCLTFIVGQGEHSDVQAVVKPAVLEVLREEFCLEHMVDSANPGRIHAWLRPAAKA